MSFKSSTSYIAQGGDTAHSIAQQNLGNDNREVTNPDETQFTAAEAENLQVGEETYPRNESARSADDFVRRLFELTNIERSKAGLPPLTFNSSLATAAQNHSQDMALNNYISHTGLNGSSPFDRMKSAGYQFSAAAENIAAGQSTPEEAIASWINEVPPNDGHRRNILNPAYREIGIGYFFVDNNYHHYWTQNFGTPL